MSNSLKNKYAIVGVGYTKQGKIPNRGAASFHVEACIEALKDSGIEKEDIDGLILYRHFAALPGDTDVSAFTVAEQLGIKPTILSQEAYCTRTWLAHAIGLLEAGICKNILVSYGDNGRSGRRNFVNEIDQGRAVNELASYGDFSTMAKYAMFANRAIAETGTGPDVWRTIAVAQREFANLNPRANMYKKRLTVEEYDSSNFLVEPFRIYDATPIIDGGRAIIITSVDYSMELKKAPIYIQGFGIANMPKSPSQMSFEDSRYSATKASRDALSMAGITLDNIDACQIYDCFTYTVEATLRDYGFFRPGEARDFITREMIGPSGSLPINTSGGMLSEAYFMGLTPISEAVMQLRYACSERQLGKIPGSRYPNIIMCSDNGGVFQSHCTVILSRQKG